MKFFRPLIFFLLWANTLFSGEVNFHYPRGAFERIRVYKFEDEFSRKPILLVDTVTDASGNVRFHFQCSAITPVEFRTSQCFGKWFMEPAADYNLEMLTPDTNIFRTSNNLPEVIIQNLNKEKECLSDSIRRFEEKLDSFYRANAPQFLQHRIRLLSGNLAEFRKELEKEFTLNKVSFFSIYVNYMLAPIEEAVYQNKNQIHKKYFSPPYYFNHPAYVSYFKQFFKKYIRIISNKSISNFLLNDINESGSLELLDQHLLQNDSLITNDTLRQMLVIVNLAEMFYEKNFDRNNIEKMLTQISRSKGLTPLHSLVAKNLLGNLTFFDRGNAAPDFEAMQNDGKLFQLQQLKGNWIFISFVSPIDQHSISETKALNKIALKYGLKVKFIYVLMEGSDEEVSSLLKFVPAGSTLLDDRKVKAISSLYKVSDYPRFFFLDPDLDIFDSKAPAPSEGLELYLKQSLKK